MSSKESLERREGDRRKDYIHFSREIPVAVLVVLFAQFIGLVWYQATYQAQTTATLEKHEWRISFVENNRDTGQVNTNAQKIAVLNGKISDLESSMQRDIQFMQGGMTRIENKLDRLIEGKQ